MATRKMLSGFAAIAATTMMLTSCAGGTDAAGEGTGSGEVAGSITFLTNRTDLETDGTWDRYVSEFQKTYPDADVTVEAITNYEDDVRTRMSTTDFGDVLLVPDAVGVDQYVDFFEPLGSVDELKSDYRFVSDKSVDGEVYAIAVGGNTFGVLYNKAVFAAAGITDLPTTPDAFIADLQKIKDDTDATPLYTNYKDGWPLAGQWTDSFAGAGGDGDVENAMAEDASPWAEGKPAANVDGLLWDAVAASLTEEDPLTTNWEQSKNDLAAGKIGAMVLGSWAVSQFQAAATATGGDPADIGFMAFPVSIDGVQHAKIGGDRRMAINVNSDNKATARAWVDFLVKDSDFAEINGMISPSTAVTDLPTNLADVQAAGVELFENNPAPAGKEGLLNNVADASQVDVWGNIYRQQLVDAARGQSDTSKSAFFADLDSRWGAAVSSLG